MTTLTHYEDFDSPPLEPGFFISPAFLIPDAASCVAFSTPVPMLDRPSPTGLPKLPVALLMVSPSPRVAAPTTPPAVVVTPPSVLPSVEVTVLPVLEMPEVMPPVVSSALEVVSRGMLDILVDMGCFLEYARAFLVLV